MPFPIPLILLDNTHDNAFVTLKQFKLLYQAVITFINGSIGIEKPILFITTGSSVVVDNNLVGVPVILVFLEGILQVPDTGTGGPDVDYTYDSTTGTITFTHNIPTGAKVMVIPIKQS